MYHLITINQKDKWTWYVRNSAEHDFYHTWYYHSMDQSGEPFLFIYEENENYIAFPLLNRKIEDSGFSDFTSVYGYTGPISNRKFEQLEDSFMENFKRSFLSFLKSKESISVFSRLHPLLQQNFLLEKFGGVYQNGKTISIDLTVPIEHQRLKYRRTTYDDIKRSWRRGFIAKETKEPEDIQIFKEIYIENMKRVGASDYYLFTDQYFHDMVNADEFDCILVLVFDGTEAICGSITTFTDGIAECHLTATRTKYLWASPSKFLIDEISQIGRKYGMKHYHLGGGYGFKEDSLFDWKLGFSDLMLNYNSWRYITDEARYNTLVQKSGVDQNIDIDFFPLYRYSQTLNSLK
ncbi:GNAT family N-acetyltransferase [Pedobacter nyackensis]|uniref:Acetyltransferase (GNAT) domain-containing protein n=1 Tax=Pedobacter nyackensis TaxID=475255 RepID=A0A1W2DCX0_9SPHI|nr:GNAT family N-acetyltransferase [Pedobacter nyackensis]SMC95233.1 Acetyltransferase (GNAT) domain-containing protein [Pedobacter nyackensis]